MYKNIHIYINTYKICQCIYICFHISVDQKMGNLEKIWKERDKKVHIKTYDSQTHTHLHPLYQRPFRFLNVYITPRKLHGSQTMTSRLAALSLVDHIFENNLWAAINLSPLGR